MRKEHRYQWVFGELTVSDHTHGLHVYVSSRNDDDRRTRFTLAAWRLWLTIYLPNWVLAPHVERVTWAQGSYQRITERQYGFSYGDGFLNVQYGRNSHDEQRWGYFIPWLQWSHVRHSLYDLTGSKYTDLNTYGGDRWRKETQLRDSCPTATYWFLDYDGELISASTRIEEHEWHRGTGWWKWLKHLYRPKVRRSLTVDFSAETGERKGSWKGGTLGHGIDMEPGELHHHAFRRYCGKHRMTFLGELPAVVHHFKIAEIVKWHDAGRIQGEDKYVHVDGAWCDRHPHCAVGDYFVQADNGLNTYTTKPLDVQPVEQAVAVDVRMH